MNQTSSNLYYSTNHTNTQTPQPTNDVVVVGNNNTSTMKKEFYVIQRCWYSGPQLDAPVDYLRLFETRRDAEEIAYHSAHAYANQQPSKGSGSNIVRTILLPPSANNISNSSSYAFQTCGKLFWVRSIITTWVPPPPTTTHPPPQPLFQQQPVPANTTSLCCKAILTEGVIGGTGNKNSRRGVEINEGRVFIGMFPTTDTSYIDTYVHNISLQIQATLPNHVQVTVRYLPIGKPEDTQYTSGMNSNSVTYNGLYYNFKDWPDAQSSSSTTMPAIVPPVPSEVAPYLTTNNNPIALKRDYTIANTNNNTSNKRTCFDFHKQQQQQEQHLLHQQEPQFHHQEVDMMTEA